MKKHDLSKITIIPPSMSSEANKLMPLDFNQLPGWGEFKERDQEFLAGEIRSLSGAKLAHLNSGLAMGKHIKNIHDTCESYSGSFKRIMLALGFQERTAYRYKDAYVNSEKSFPDTILKVAIMRGFDITSASTGRPLGKYTEVYNMISLPRNPTVDQANRYLDQLHQTYLDRKRGIANGSIKLKAAEAKVAKRDPEYLLMSNFHGIRSALKKVPAAKRRTWFNQLVGMSMHYMGFASATMFEPEAAPEEYKRGPGRPSKKGPEHPQSVHEAA